VEVSKTTSTVSFSLEDLDTTIESTDIDTKICVKVCNRMAMARFTGEEEPQPLPPLPCHPFFRAGHCHSLSHIQVSTYCDLGGKKSQELKKWRRDPLGKKNHNPDDDD
jgi:hypothetical protein